MLIETPMWCIASLSRVAKAFRHSVLTFLSVWVVNPGHLTESRDRSSMQVQDVHRAGPRAHHYHANHSRSDGDFFLLCASIHLFHSNTLNFIPLIPQLGAAVQTFLAGCYGVPVTGQEKNVPETECDRETGGCLEKIIHISLISTVQSVLWHPAAW